MNNKKPRRPIGPKEQQWIERNRPYAVAIATHIYRKHGGKYALNDIVSYAFEALVDAAGFYDPEKGSATTFLSFRIPSIISRYVKNECYSHPVRVPIFAQERHNREFMAASKVEAQTGERVQIEPLPMQHLASKVRILDGRDPNDLDAIESECTRTPEEIYEAKEAAAIGFDAVKDERLRSVIIDRYFNDCTLDDVGGRLGICRERVRQIQQEAFEIMREEIERRNNDK